jgi:hypothetical protein
VSSVEKSGITTSNLLSSFSPGRELILALAAILESLGGSIVLDRHDLAVMNLSWGIEILDVKDPEQVIIRLVKE